VFVFFALVAGDRGFLTWTGAGNYLAVAAEIGIIAAPIALLAIAGEFDLSVGSMVGAAGVVVAITVVEYNWPLELAVPFVLVCAGLTGFVIGWLVITTGLPSFIVTLAFLFILRGATIALTSELTGGTQVGGIRDEVEDSFLYGVLAGDVGEIPASVFWWIGITAAATWVLMRTRFGNWTLGSGGDPLAARNMGVPVAYVKIALFVCTSLAASLVALITVLQAGSADVLRGQNKEFQAITAAVIGGTLLTGGYGSAVGAAFGALIFGIVSQGLFFASVDSNWFQVFLGVLLLLAVLLNRFVQVRSGAVKR
jgi:simple sugar transport system permease protein